MEPKVILFESWITLYFIASYLLIFILKVVDENKFELIKSPLMLEFKLKSNSSDFKLTSFFMPLLVLFSLMVYSFFFSVLISEYGKTMNVNLFFKVLKVLTLLIVGRFFLVNYIFKVLGGEKGLKHYQLKTIFAHFYLSLFILIGLFLYEYFFSTSYSFLLVLSIVIIITYIVLQFEILNKNSKFVVRFPLYYILYLCIFKICPWILIYTFLFKQ